MKKIVVIVLSWMLAVSIVLPVALTLTKKGVDAAVFKSNAYMENLQLPTLQQYNEKDWEQVTIDYLTWVFDENNVYESAENGTRKIARYTSSNNAKAYFESIGMPDAAPEEIWSIPPYIAKGDNVTLGEGITVIAAIMSGALVGMDLTAYECSDGVTRNFVKSAVEYYQANGEHVVLNGGAGGKTGSTWWYELLPGVLFSVLGTVYESEAYYMYDIITESARAWRSAVEGLGGASADFWHTSYSIERGEPFDGNWYEPDAAAGMAYILYSAYSMNKELKESGKETFATDEEIEKFREAAIWCMNYLDELNESPFYEVLTFLAPYLAARLNAEQGTNYDVAKMIGWTLDGSSAVRGGWGMITENWGGVYTNGLMGSHTDGGGYAFAMNTFDAMLGFAPMVKYDTRFARDISRWVLCVSQSAQAYYPENYSTEGSVQNYYGHQVYNGKYQSGNLFEQDDPEAGFIAYEGLRKYRRYVTYDSNGTRGTAWDNSVSPYACGDAFTFDWGGETDYGLYGSSHVGLFGSTIDYTDVPMIIRTDLNKLDVYHSGDIPFWMYYNPYDTAKTVTVELTEAGNRLYDTIEKQYVETTGSGTTVRMTIPADTTFILAEIPAGATVEKNGSNYTCNGEFIAQERGTVTLSLYKDANGQQAISSGASVEGTIYASLSAVAPESAQVESITLTYGSSVLYEGTLAPSGLVEIDTKQLRNGKGTMTAMLTLSGGSIEKSSINLQVLNVDKSSAIEYDSPQDMADTWNSATQEWQSMYSTSDHTSSIAANADGSMTITAESPKGYGFVTSELFNLDFSRGPMLEINVTNVSSSCAIKVYVEGMENMTGEYIVSDTSSTGAMVIDILAEIQKEDYTFKPEGVRKVSIKISPVGSQGDTVTFTDFTVYHMYTTPVLEEPDSYEWGRNFTSVWMSMWSASSTDGGVGNAVAQYTNDGTMRVSSSDAGTAYSGIASPLIAVDMGQNPVLDLSLASLSGKYFVGVEFSGSSKLYVIADDQTATENFIEVAKALRANYPDETFTGTANMRVVVGVKGEGIAEFTGVNTYYQLTGWGTEVEDEAWLEWEKAEGMTATADFALDSSNRMVITNGGSSASDTAVAGISGKFTMNFDYNPELEIRVRGLTGKWRLTLSVFDGNKYTLTDWSENTGTYNVNIRDIISGVNGQQNIYLTIEVLGGGKSVTVQYIDTFYTVLNPAFEDGKVYYSELATWNKDEINSSNVSVDRNQVTVSESARESKGLFTDSVAANASFNPHIVVNVAALGENSAWYLNAIVNKISYRIGEGISVGTFTIDVVAALASQGCILTGDFSAIYEIGAEGDAFSVTFNGVQFAYKLNAPASLEFTESTNSLSWDEVSGAAGYKVRITDADGEIMAAYNSYNSVTLGLNALELPTGVYRVYVSAYGSNVLSSEEVNIPFKQGDIESIQLSAPANLTVEGMLIVWDEVANAEGYLYVLTDADTNQAVSSATVTDTFIDLAQIGLPAFNYKVTVQAKGDGVVYLDSAVAEYSFYTNTIENYNAKKFASMAANDNQASASYDEASDVATLTVPYTNWGSIIALETQLNFDKSPVLFVEFAAGCEGGYFMQLMVDGTEYYLCDNTFTIHGNTESELLYIDINATLNSREDGPATPFTGTHAVRVIFGATSDGIAGVNSPVVKIKLAQLIEMTEGSGVAKLGTLDTPVVTVTNGVASWTAIPNAQAYVVVVSNELGVLISQTVTGTSFDCSAITRAGEYIVQVTATADTYYSSDTGSTTFTISEQASSPEEPQKTGCSGAVGTASFAIVGAILLIACGTVIFSRSKERK